MNVRLPFSVVMSVYYKDEPDFVSKAINSITQEQTYKPNEIVLVVDGPVSDNLRELINKFESSPEFKIIWLPENKGLGNALHIGVEAAKYPVIARMDSDDIAASDRFQKQIAYLQKHPECDIVGGQISEFIDKEDNIVGKRIVPCEHKEIRMWLKGRCPFNHMTVMLLRPRILEVGNYLDWHFNEDYYLWIRMAQKGCNFANLPDVLVNVRVGKDMYARRGGWKYFKSEKGLQDYMLKNKMISVPRYLFNVIGRFGVQLLLPNTIRAFVFKTLFRKS